MPRSRKNLQAPRSRSARERGTYVVEFVLVLMVMLPVLFAAGEFGRVSLCDQMLARATYRAAVAAARNADCEASARAAFAADRITRWLFDANDDGEIGFVTGAAPDPAAGGEVRLDIAADDDDVSNGVDFNAPEPCGEPGSWIRVETSVPIRTRFGLGTIVRRQASWALNQT